MYFDAVVVFLYVQIGKTLFARVIGNFVKVVMREVEILMRILNMGKIKSLQIVDDLF